MRTTWKAIAIAFAFIAGLIFAPHPLFGQEQQQQSEEQKKKEQEKAKEQQKQREKEQQAQESVSKILQQYQQQQQQPQQPQQPQPQQQQQPKPQPQPQQPRYQPQQPPPAQQQQPQWQQEPRSHRDLPQLDREPRRLSPQRQRDLIQQQKRRQTQYDHYLQDQQRLLERRGDNLERQHRSAQYRYHQRYLDHLRRQQSGLWLFHDFFSDPFFFTAPSYRYSRGGRWYEVNEYAAALLQDAVNYGYEEGYGAGEADREDGWEYECEASFAYQDANYGYEGLYVSSDEYHFYFREGFRRGYEDGYYGRHRYGAEVDGSLRIMSDVLRLIIDLRVLR